MSLYVLGSYHLLQDSKRFFPFLINYFTKMVHFIVCRNPLNLRVMSLLAMADISQHWFQIISMDLHTVIFPRNVSTQQLLLRILLNSLQLDLIIASMV